MNIVTICKEFDFDAAHYLPNVPKGHKCGRMHGHTYRCRLYLSGAPDNKLGWFVDYAEIASAWQRIHDVIDHRTLNEIPGLENPTTEVLTPWVWSQMSTDKKIGAYLRKIRVYESSTTFCEFCGPGAP